MFHENNSLGFNSFNNIGIIQVPLATVKLENSRTDLRWPTRKS